MRQDLSGGFNLVSISFTPLEPSSASNICLMASFIGSAYQQRPGRFRAARLFTDD